MVWLLLHQLVTGVRKQFEAHEARDVASQLFSPLRPKVRVVSSPNTVNLRPNIW